MVRAIAYGVIDLKLAGHLAKHQDPQAAPAGFVADFLDVLAGRT
ncbi:hypothetical protein GCM10023169_25130 [Georgenia halophila]|uniref:Tetracyclin repressor-like C-terminal domain-containing protein n=1 Tax=Georgenia halophila TaxID=620889 RepID=A0ABP8LCI1_9MICO